MKNNKSIVTLIRVMEGFAAVKTYIGTHNIYLVLINDEPYAWAPLDKGADVFGRLVSDRKMQLEQDLGHSLTEVATTDSTGGCVVTFESKTRSYIWGGMRNRCKLQLKKISDLRVQFQ